MYFGGSLAWGDFAFLLSGAVTTIAITLVAVLIGTSLGVLFGQQGLRTDAFGQKRRQRGRVLKP